jgi:DNA-binding MarR family transcriptional regulator
MDDRVQASLIALRRILRATELHGRALSRATGLTTPQLIVLQIVKDARETTPKEIARKAGISQATVTALIDKLQSKDMVARAKGESDRRQVWVRLTDAGEAAIKAAPDALQDLFAEAFSALPNWEQAMLVAALERIAGLLNAETMDASPLLDASAIEH